ncbi:MAG TPA: DUF58 domain-containing protein [Bryobacteraceae bacterium]
MTSWEQWRDRLHLPAGRQHMTGAGMVFRAALVGIAAAAFLLGNNLLFLIVAAMFATLLISGFVTRLGLAGLELDLLLPEHIPARRDLRGKIRLRNSKSWTPSFSVQLAGVAESGFNSILNFPVIAGGATIEESVTLHFPRRGAQRERSFQFSTRFPFGFAERREMVTLRHEIIVYPCLDPQPGFETLLEAVSGQIAAMQRGRGHDFYRIRPYEAMESARHVDWKATAHTGALQVREFVREQDWRALIFLDLDTPVDSDAWFEKAIECCAFLAYRLTVRGVEVRFRTQELDLSLPEEGDIYTLLKYLALVSPMRGKPPLAPDETGSFQIVFTAQPGRMESLGWDVGDSRTSRLLCPDAFKPAS